MKISIKIVMSIFICGIYVVAVSCSEDIDFALDEYTSIASTKMTRNAENVPNSLTVNDTTVYNYTVTMQRQEQMNVYSYPAAIRVRFQKSAKEINAILLSYQCPVPLCTVDDVSFNSSFFPNRYVLSATGKGMDGLQYSATLPYYFFFRSCK